jgi:hypothetical protein
LEGSSKRIEQTSFLFLSLKEQVLPLLGKELSAFFFCEEEETSDKAIPVQ